MFEDGCFCLDDCGCGFYCEVGPIPSWSTPWCTNAISILHSCGFDFVNRIELGKRSENQLEYDEMTMEEYDSDTELTIEPKRKNTPKVYNNSDFAKLLKKYQIEMDETDQKHYIQMFQSRGNDGKFTETEFLDLVNSNSEHSRHHFFRGNVTIDNKSLPSLMDLIKRPLEKIGSNENISLVAFKDDASAIRGSVVCQLLNRSANDTNTRVLQTMHPTFTAETHNFPCLISPFAGAATGVGGRIRDTIAIGRGGTFIAGTAGYCVEDTADGTETLIEMSNGASDYGNKVGEPIIQGFCRQFTDKSKMENPSTVYSYKKPIMFSGGTGLVSEESLVKKDLVPGLLICQIGGPAYRIGMGGGMSSSKANDTDTQKDQDIQAVQRGDPEMENKVVRVIQAFEQDDLIHSLSDQGAGGLGNVVKELVYPLGGVVYENLINVGDPTLTVTEKWVAEYQESMCCLVTEENVEKMKAIAKRENAPFSVIGTTNDSKRIVVKTLGVDGAKFVDFPMEEILGDLPKKEYRFEKPKFVAKNFDYKNTIENTIENCQKCDLDSVVQQILGNLDTGSKRFLVNKVDRSVTGLIAQQQSVGRFQTPISDYALVAHSFLPNTKGNITGTVTTVGERPILSLYDVKTMVSVALIESLTSMMGVKIGSLNNVRCSVNWMWPEKNVELYSAMEMLSELMCKLGVAADGGKDSLSMKVKTKNKVYSAPGSCVISSYAFVENILERKTPELKSIDSNLYLIDFSILPRGALTGTVYSRVVPDFKKENELPVIMPKEFKNVWYFIQNNFDLIESIHDISDGGLLTTVAEMAIAGDIGVDFKVDNLAQLFSEEPGIVVSVPKKHCMEWEKRKTIGFKCIGKTTTNKKFIIRVGENKLDKSDKSDNVYEKDLITIRDCWEKESTVIEKKQIPEPLAIQQHNIVTKQGHPLPNAQVFYNDCKKINTTVAVIREEGSNGEKEMEAMWSCAGFNVKSVNTRELLKNPELLQQVQCLAFVGGFSFMDVFGAATGWANVIQKNEKLLEALKQFYQRTDTFSLGVCNGCQLMVQLNETLGIGLPKCKLVQNESKRFESRQLVVRVKKSNSVFLKDMENQQEFIWVAHGEGRFEMENSDRVALEYSSEEYPLNPNGSAFNAAGITSENGRHISLMPHPERSFLNWQQGKIEKGTSFWFNMVKNINEYCVNELQTNE